MQLYLDKINVKQCVFYHEEISCVESDKEWKPILNKLSVYTFLYILLQLYPTFISFILFGDHLNEILRKEKSVHIMQFFFLTAVTNVKMLCMLFDIL